MTAIPTEVTKAARALAPKAVQNVLSMSRLSGLLDENRILDARAKAWGLLLTVCKLWEDLFSGLLKIRLPSPATSLSKAPPFASP